MSQLAHQVCLMLGSNIQPEKNLPLAVRLLRQHITVVRISSVWETPAVGSNGPNFLNAAVLGATNLDAQALKDQVLRPIEIQLGRVRTADKFAPRPIDLDITIWDGRLLDSDLYRHVYLATPVAEILPDFHSEGIGESLEQVANRLARVSQIQHRPDVTLS